VAGSKRQRELAHRRAERQAVRRREAAARRRKQRLIVGGTGVGVLLLVVGIFLVAKNSRDDKHKKDAVQAAASASAAAASAAASDASAAASPSPDNRPVACGASAPVAAAPQTFAQAPAMTIDPTKKYVATIKTSCGVVTADLYADKAPVTINSFAFLAGKKFFDGSPCHRMNDSGDFFLQCGDPTGTGSGDLGYTVKDENLPTAGADGSYVYPAGTLAMANTGAPDSGSSQFFIVIKDSPFGPNYTPFGKVTGGQDVLDKILALGQDNTSQAGGGAPKQKVFIESFTVTQAP
jgi:peptidyl-prolyl cis-trans isomerase B (cyclophilin B)